VCELAAAIGLLVPRLAASAALGLTGLMAGALVTNLLIGVNPAMPAGFLLAAASSFTVAALSYAAGLAVIGVLIASQLVGESGGSDGDVFTADKAWWFIRC
jgi:predicted membrane protein